MYRWIACWAESMRVDDEGSADLQPHPYLASTALGDVEPGADEEAALAEAMAGRPFATACE